MKTTVEIDEARIKRVMKSTGLKTRKAAIDYALHLAERAERIERLVREAPPDADFANAVVPTYDLVKLREREKPATP